MSGTLRSHRFHSDIYSLFSFHLTKTLTLREKVMSYLGTLAIVHMEKQNNGTLIVTYTAKPTLQFHLKS